ncbi:hypothetical protein NMY22_g6542 [Coprinellus aureogranulatus]|nr:hypothetical protein NMY22_g6542 [Coprinellus aureogranulatus]
MEDEYADGRSASSKSTNSAPEAVISTSGLRLKKLTVKKLKEGGVQRYMEMLALPKVVLEKTIKEALEPPPPAKKKKKPAGEALPGAPTSGWQTAKSCGTTGVLQRPPKKSQGVGRSTTFDNPLSFVLTLMSSAGPPPQAALFAARNGSLQALNYILYSWPAHYSIEVLDVFLAHASLDGVSEWERHELYQSMHLGTHPFPSVGKKHQVERVGAVFLTLVALVRLQECMERWPELKGKTALKLKKSLPDLTSWILWNLGCDPALKRTGAPYQLNFEAGGKEYEEERFGTTLVSMQLLLELDPRLEEEAVRLDSTMEILIVLWMHTSQGSPFWWGGSKPKMQKADTRLLKTMHKALAGNPPLFLKVLMRQSICTVDSFVTQTLNLVRLIIDRNGRSVRRSQFTDQAYDIPAVSFLVGVTDVLVREPRIREAFFKQGGVAVYGEITRLVQFHIKQDGTTAKLRHPVHWMSHMLAWSVSSSGYLLSNVSDMVKDGILMTIHDSFDFPFRNESELNESPPTSALALAASKSHRRNFTEIQKDYRLGYTDLCKAGPAENAAFMLSTLLLYLDWPRYQPTLYFHASHHDAASFIRRDDDRSVLYLALMAGLEERSRFFKKKNWAKICDNLDHDSTNHTRSRAMKQQTCSKCHSVIYCSTDCQKQDWAKRHREECRATHAAYIERKHKDEYYSKHTRSYQISLILNSFGELLKDAPFPDRSPSKDTLQVALVGKATELDRDTERSSYVWVLDGSSRMPPTPHTLNEWLAECSGLIPQYLRPRVDAVVKMWEQSLSGCDGTTADVGNRPGLQLIDVMYEYGQLLLHLFILVHRAEEPIQHESRSFEYDAVASLTFTAALHHSDPAVENTEDAKTEAPHPITTQLVQGGFVRNAAGETHGAMVPALIKHWARLSYKSLSRSPQLLYGIDVSPTMRFVERATALGAAALSAIGPLLPHFKDTVTSRGLRYHYYFSAPEAGKPTLLLIHGFPSLAVDWHSQITHFREKGYGVVAADQLGYGGTDKPADSAVYVHSLQARDMVDILDHENITDVVAVGHDWGSKTVSVLANLYSDRFLGFGFLACGYRPPHGMGSTLEELREQSIELLGYETFGYWEFFTAPDAPEVIQRNLGSWFDLLYARDGRLWRFNMAPTGAFRIFLESGSRSPRITATVEPALSHTDQFGRYTLDGPLNYYRISLNGETKEDDDTIPLESYTVTKPVFFGGAHGDVICVDWAEEAAVRKYSPNLTVANFNTTHWVAADAPHALNEALEKWINEVVLA